VREREEASVRAIMGDFSGRAPAAPWEDDDGPLLREPCGYVRGRVVGGGMGRGGIDAGQ
jgi:hypothetical protein